MFWLSFSCWFSFKSTLIWKRVFFCPFHFVSTAVTLCSVFWFAVAVHGLHPNYFSINKVRFNHCILYGNARISFNYSSKLFSHWWFAMSSNLSFHFFNFFWLGDMYLTSNHGGSIKWHSMCVSFTVTELFSECNFF